MEKTFKQSYEGKVSRTYLGENFSTGNASGWFESNSNMLAGKEFDGAS